MPSYWILVAALVLGVPGFARAEEEPSVREAPAKMPGIEDWRRFEFSSGINGEKYCVVIFTPRRAAPGSG
jgi:hypothetical protein